MNELGDVTVRQMNQEDVRLAVEWAAREGWNPGLHDAECFYAADPNGFFVAWQKGEPAGCLSAVAYDKHFAFAGFYIVKPEWRSHGIGHQLVRKATAYLGRRTVGNDAVVAQQETYRQLGFVTAYRNIRYQGVGLQSEKNVPEIVDLRTIPFGDVAVYDRGLFPADRAAFLNCWINQPDSTALGYLQNGKLSGYGAIRKCRQGYKIGPLFADHEEIAGSIFRALIAAVPGEEYFLDIPEPNAAACALVRRHALSMVFETARMYLGEAPSLPLEKIFGVTSFELG
ncbi:MAG: N-acetyltransferase [Deltaproteobacteria bacterium]|nr:N-acetyltransferase [Deltaproteobacteria bacterium]